MLNSVFGITKNPFSKDPSSKDIFLSACWESASKHLNLLIKYRGIGIVTGEPGTGKSTLVRVTASGLNPKAYRILYLCDVLLSDIDFLKLLAVKLGTEPPFHKGKLIRSIRDTLIELNDSQRIQPILILDEVHLVRMSLLEQIRILTNFHMDSRDLLTTILIGQSHFLNKLSLNINLQRSEHSATFLKNPESSFVDSFPMPPHNVSANGTYPGCGVPFCLNLRTGAWRHSQSPGS